MKPLISTRTRITRNCEIRLNRQDIIHLAKQELKAQGHYPAVPDDAEVEFHVPGGGEWSSTSIDIDDQNPVTIRWTEEESNDD